MNILKKLISFLTLKVTQQPESEDRNPKQIKDQIDNELNVHLYKLLKQHFPAIYFKDANRIIITDNGLTVKAEVFNRTEHPNMISMQINFLTVHKVHFPNGIEESLAGFGTDDLTAIKNGIGSFIEGQFPVILRALTAEQNPDIDFVTKGIKDSEEKWHTIIGALQVQGEWKNKQEELEFEKFYSIYRPLLEFEFKKNEKDFHWSRAYISIMPDGNFIGDCFLDNQPWTAGLEELRNYSKTWEVNHTFSGMKQFIMFRKCINHC